jgi:hypothetical protein
MTTPGIIEQLDRCLAFENELIATVGEEFYIWIADRATKRAASAGNEGRAQRRDGHSKLVYDKERRTIVAIDPHPVARNEGGADYEAKARQTTDWILGFMEDECSLLPECVDWADRRNIANAIVNALAQSAADERRRCEAIARAAENYGAEFPVGSYESTYKHGRHGRDAAKDIADAIAANE